MRDHFETFRAQAADLRDGEGLPGFVEQEFYKFLQCGALGAVPFVKRSLSHITPRERIAKVPKGVAPVGLYLLYGVVTVGLTWLAMAVG